jgi:transcriptional regulator with XRE-family HTH domain
MRTRAGLSRKALAELAGVSDGTIKLIEYGDTEEPEPTTLRKLADGLAKNRAVDRVDPEAARSLYETLMAAAGYSVVDSPIQSSDLEAAIRAAGNPPSRVAMLAAFLRRYPNMTPGERRLVDGLIDATLQRIARPGEPN